MKIAIGIDPGKQGVITFIKEGIIVSCPITLINNEIDIKACLKIFADEIQENDKVHCVIESVHAIYGASAKSTFSFGFVNGVLETIVSSLGIPYTKVPPKVWQKEMWQGIPLSNKSDNIKAMSFAACKRIFPNLPLTRTERCKKDDDNMADSLLIAEFCRRKFL